MESPPCVGALHAARLQSLYEPDYLLSAPDKSFQRIVELAAHICGAPVSAISLVDRDRRWLMASLGTGPRRLERDGSFCEHAVQSSDVFVVEDARRDRRFAAHPAVVGEPGCVAYAGAPLIDKHGAALGALHVVHNRPMRVSDEARRALVDLAALSVDLMERAYEEQCQTIMMSAVSDVGHYVRSVLCGAAETADALEATPLSDVQQYQLDFMREANAEILQALNCSLDVMSLRKGARVADIETFSAVDVATRTISALRAISPDRRIQLRSHLSGEGELRLGDRALFQRIVYSMLSNVVESGECLGAHVTLDGDHRTLSCEVTNVERLDAATPHAWRVRESDIECATNRYGRDETDPVMLIIRQLLQALGGSFSVYADSAYEKTFVARFPYARAPRLS